MSNERDGHVQASLAAQDKQSLQLANTRDAIRGLISTPTPCLNHEGKLDWSRYGIDEYNEHSAVAC
jgi:hypothetical protein